MTDKTESTTSQKKRSILSNLLQLSEKTSFWKRVALILFAIILLTQVLEISITPKLSFLKNPFLSKQQDTTTQAPIEPDSIDTASLTKAVLPDEGVELPIIWGDLGKQMIVDGVIDEAKYRALFEGGLTNTEEQMLSGSDSQPIVLTEANSRHVLNMLWAFGLANKNDILENGEMTDKQYGGAGNFASTGGWSLARGLAMDHYSKHAYIVLTP